MPNHFVIGLPTSADSLGWGFRCCYDGAANSLRIKPDPDAKPQYCVSGAEREHIDDIGHIAADAAARVSAVHQGSWLGVHNSN